MAVVGSVVVEYLATGARAFIQANKEAAAAIAEVESKAKTVQDHLQGVVSPLSSASKAVTQFGDGVIHAGQVLSTFAYRLTLITAPLAKFIYEAVQAGTELETVMAMVATQLEKGEEYIARFTEETTRYITDLSLKFPLATDDIAKAMYYLVSSLTIDPEVARSMLEPIAKAAVAGRATAEEAAKAATVVMQVYDLISDDAAETAANLEHVYDVIFLAVQKGRAEYADMASQLGDFVKIAQQAGATFEEVMALFAMATREIDPSIAATWIKRMYTELTRPGFMEAMEKFGVQMWEYQETADGVVKSMRPAIDIVTDFGAVLGSTADEQEKLNMVHEAFPNIRALQGFLTYIQHLPELEEWTKSFTEAIGTVDAAFEIMVDLVKAQLVLLGNAFIAIGTDVFELYKEDLKRFLAYMKDVLETLREMDPELQKQLIAWSAFLLALGPIALVLGTILMGLGGLITTLGTLISPVALGGAILAIDLFGDLFAEAGDAVDAFGGGLPGLITFLASLAVELGLIPKAEAEKALEALGIEAMISTDKVAPLAAEIRELVETISEFADKVKTAAGWIAEHFDAIKVAVYGFIGVWGAMKLLVWTEQLLSFALAIKGLGAATVLLSLGGLEKAMWAVLAGVQALLGPGAATAFLDWIIGLCAQAGPIGLLAAALLGLGVAIKLRGDEVREQAAAIEAEHQAILEICQTYEEYETRLRNLLGIQGEYVGYAGHVVTAEWRLQEAGMLTREEFDKHKETFERQKEAIEEVMPTFSTWAGRLEAQADAMQKQILPAMDAWAEHLQKTAALFELNTEWLDELTQKAEELVVVSGKDALIALANYADAWGEAALDFARCFQEMIESQEEYERRRAEIMAGGVDKTQEEVDRELKILEEAWAKEQEAQRKHLGQMLMQQIDVWATMDETVAEHALEMKLVVAEQFGIITEEAAEMANGTLAILEEWRREGVGKTEAFAAAFDVYVEALQSGKSQTEAFADALDAVDWHKELVIEENLQELRRRALEAKQAVDSIKSKTVSVHFERTGWSGVQETSPKIRIQVALEELDTFLRSTVFEVQFKAAEALDTLLSGEALESTIEQMREFVEAFAELVVWYDELWDKVVKKSALEELELVFGGLGKMAETLVALSELAGITVPSLEELFALLEDLVDRMATFVIRYDEIWDVPVKKHAIEELGLMFDMIAKLGDALEGLMALTGEGVELLAGPEWQAGLTRFFDALDAFIAEFVSRAEVWQEQVNEETAALAGWVGETVTSLTAAIEPLVELADYAPDQSAFKAGVDLFFANLEYFLDEFAWGMWRFKELASEEAAQTAELIGRAVVGLGETVQPLLDLAEYAPDPAAISQGIRSFFDHLGLFLDEFAARADDFDAKISEKSADLAELLGRAAGGLGEAVQPLLDLADYTVTSAEFARAADLFFDHLALFLEMFAERADEFDAHMTEEIAALAEAIGKAVGGIGAAIQPLIDLAAYGYAVDEAGNKVWWDPEDLVQSYEHFFYHLGMILFFLEEEARRWQVSDAARALAEAVGEVCSNLSATVGFLIEVADYGVDYSAFALLGFQHFLEDLWAIVAKIEEASGTMGPAVELARIFAEDCVEVLAAIQRGIDKLNALTGLGVTPENLVEAGKLLIQSLADGFVEAVDTEWGRMLTAFSDQFNAFVNNWLPECMRVMHDRGWNIGANLIWGMIEGLASQASMLYDTVWQIVQNAVAAAEAAAEAFSESRSMRRLGANMVRGLIGGIEAQRGALAATLSGLADYGGFSLQPALAGMGAGASGGEVHYHNDNYYTVNPRYEQVVSPANIQRDLEALAWQNRKNRV